MTFDFKIYLEQLDPVYMYQVERLTGGVINFTVRANKTSLVETMAAGDGRHEVSNIDLYKGTFPGHKSLILKHAPSHVAEIGDVPHIPQTRQLVEAAALTLFLPDLPSLQIHPEAALRARSISLQHILAQTRVTVPELLYHDSNSHVLVLSDLGPLPDLSKIFSGLGGYTPGQSDGLVPPTPTNNSPRLGQELQDDQVAKFELLGRKLGSFFALLHSRHVHEAILSSKASEQAQVATLDHQDNFPVLPEMRKVVHEHAIQPLKSQLLHFPDLLTAAEAESLFLAVEADFLRETPKAERSFVVGDSWTGTVLVDLEQPDEDVGLGIIDWEFSSTSGRGINGDISQFLAHLELFLIAAKSRGGDAAGYTSALKAILSDFIAAYKANWDGASSGDPNRMIMRSAFLSHGAELINCAFWKSWICKERNCAPCQSTHVNESDNQGPRKQDSLSGFEDQHKDNQCKLITKMVSRGISYLRCAVAEDPSKSVDELGQNEEIASLADLFA